MEWSDIRLFLAIAREGTLGAAARSLGLTQPTMGRRLKALELAIGHALFQRTADGFVLTGEGQIAYAHAVRMESEAIALQREISGSEAALSGSMRISCSDWFGIHVLGTILAGFALRHPGVTVELLTDARLLNLSRREADLVFRIRPFEETEVVSRKLMHIPYDLYVAAGAADPVAGGSGCGIVTMDEAFGDMPDAIWLRERYPQAKVAFRSNNRDVQAKLCASGVGMAVLPRPLGDGDIRLRRIELDESPPGRDTWLGYHRDLRRLGRLRALIDAVLSGTTAFRN
ncbi:LysR family transcriptional regulator [Rhizobiaceae bacterium n13]|uniref:LysR family transcriptional regulator n=1 Tax=Ferirhizobium litorale TaxID=2927786 RepID=A0AAE3U3M4_9HYPH|nr:LysR family transcriptional regulator [Fererhizobium litorale]MDI7862866.1 LysR family transcriptional regulator [Fererhizobium litorale]MDI7923952.1 LysR family transcriptional regulator [Fererhizobium litorale]